MSTKKKGQKKPKTCISLDRLEAILYRETSCIWEDDAKLLMEIIRAEAEDEQRGS